MKDDLHKDKLEEFLRKSLEGHSEDPPGDLWSKIAGNLEPPVADVPSAAPRQMAPRLKAVRSWWSVAAAAAVVTGLLIGQHFYFSGKIEHLNKALEQNAAQLKVLEQKQVEERQKQTTLPIEEAIDNQVATQNVTTTGSELPGDELQGTTQFDQPAKQGREKSPTTNQISKGKKQQNGTDSTLPPTTLAAQTDVKNAGNELMENKGQAAETKLEQNIQASSAEATIAKQPDLPRTWGRKLSPLTMPSPTAPTVASIVPANLQQGSRYSVGLQMMPMFTKINIARKLPQEPNQNPFPPKEKESFTAEAEKSIKSWASGVALETKLTPRLRIGTGFNYRVLDIETTHEICLNYGDGKPGHGHHDEREYEYELNTATGSVQMLVSAAATVSPASLSDTTKVEASVKTSEHLAFASVPFYANYSFGNGRLRVLAKAGLIFNFLLDSKFNLDRIERPQDSKFQFDRRESRHGSPSDLQTLTASYMAGLGLEYQLSKSLSLRAEPTVMGSLTSLHNNPFIESAEFSAGLNVGMMYSF